VTPRLLQRAPARVAFPRRPSLLHPECPIEQAVRSRDARVQGLLLQEIWQRPAWNENALLIADPKSLRILARSERALRAPVAALRQRYGDALVIEPPSIRYAHGAPVLEPYMMVLLQGAAEHLAPVQRDIARRRGHVERLDRHGTRFVLEAEAPLANLLGYDAWVTTRMAGCTDPSLWLSRYLPIDDDGSYAA
jgi:hypothetical protein